jgi:hypothetical protein
MNSMVTVIMLSHGASFIKMGLIRDPSESAHGFSLGGMQ